MSKSSCPIMGRMKSQYEGRQKRLLTRRLPVIMRLDGQAFHTYTKHLTKPFDEGFIEDMQSLTMELCSFIAGAQCAYVQSDEISILITDFQTVDTQAWFDYDADKMVSIAASRAGAFFERLRNNRSKIEGTKNQPLAAFDCRVDTYPDDEVVNYFIARQRDAVKNSLSGLAQSLYSPSQLNGKQREDLHEMCFQKGHNWNNLPTPMKRGSFVEKVYYTTWMPERYFLAKEEITLEDYEQISDKVSVNTKPALRSKWVVRPETPEFGKERTLFDRYLIRQY